MTDSIELFSTFDATKIKESLKSQTENVIVDKFLNAAVKLQTSSPVGVSKQLGQPDLASGWDLNVVGFEAGEFVVELFNRAPFALNRLEGRKNGKQPPSDALISWVQLKLGVADLKKAKGIAFVIARKIGRLGTDRSKRNFREFNPATGDYTSNGAVAIAIRQIEKTLTDIEIG